MIKIIINSLLNILIAVGVGLILMMTISIIYLENFSQFAYKNKIQEIYRQIVKVTGQSQNYVPLYVNDSDIENAYTDGKKVVIYMGLVNKTKTWNEVALVLAHEVAHVNLGHLQDPMPVIDHEGMGINDAIAQLESNADKMGAVYMMRAGYDVCKGRDIFKRWLEDSGNSIGGDHPTYSYRYEELNINCE